MHDIKQILAIAVREARTELGLSQEKLAEESRGKAGAKAKEKRKAYSAARRYLWWKNRNGEASGLYADHPESSRQRTDRGGG